MVARSSVARWAGLEPGYTGEVRDAWVTFFESPGNVVRGGADGQAAHGAIDRFFFMMPDHSCPRRSKRSQKEGKDLATASAP